MNKQKQKKKKVIWNRSSLIYNLNYPGLFVNFHLNLRSSMKQCRSFLSNKNSPQQVSQNKKKKKKENDK